MRESGILVVDTSCLSHLQNPEAFARFRANLTAADLVACASELNLVEVGSASPDSVQARLLATLKAVAGTQPLLEWPFQLLTRVAKAFMAGDGWIPLHPSGKEWYLDDISAVRTLRDKVLAFQRGIERTFSELHDARRPELQSRMRERGLHDEFKSTRRFLDEYWQGSEVRQEFADATWQALGLSGAIPAELRDREESWRLLLDAEGVGVYERALAKTQPKRVHRFDLLQLAYLGGHERRIIVTADMAFLRAATEVLIGRYPNARAIHISELTAA